MSAPAGGRPKVVFFDVGDTLVRAEPSWTSVYVATLASHGIQVDEHALASALRAEPWTTTGGFEATEAAAYAAIKAFDSRVLARLGHRDLPDAVFRSLDAAFLRVESWHVFPDVVPALTAVREAGVRTGIISNWTWRAADLLADLGLAALFDTITVSARVGWQKPEAPIFRDALSAAGVDAPEAMHVGDSFAADVQGARALGMRPVLIDRSLGDPARRREPLPPGDDTPVVGDLFGVLDLVAVPRPTGVAG